ncbi:oxaloacetate decarboxylase [Falsiroseomonas sp.]|uniref:isocitrate lyase/PEP mutase family protein n=1 Tax=Falsiroseomonas sp. TaxID=2870721 RepID=UPI003564E3AE
MGSKTAMLRSLIAARTFLHMPAVYDPLGARLVAASGFEAAYVGGYVSGASRAVSEPLLTMTEQVEIAGQAAAAVEIPFVADAGAGFGEPLHTMRTVREFARAGIAGIHIEDQLFPKRAHYHKYQVHACPPEEFALKIRYACRARDEVDRDFVIIARTDTCRELGLEEAVPRLNRAADEGADLGLLFPRNPAEAERAARECRLPLVYVMSRGNRDGRPIFTIQELKDMGYVACIDAQIMLLTAFEANRTMLKELRATGTYTAMDEGAFRTARQAVEDIIGLEDFYRIEAETVER